VLGLISVTGVKYLSALLAKKNFSDDRNFFATVSVEPLVIYFVQLKTLAPSARYSTFKYPVTLKPGLGSLNVI